MITVGDVIQQFEDDTRLAPYVETINDQSADKVARWNAIRKYYAARHDEIMQACKRGGWTCPYNPGVDWLSYFTPIENRLWQVIRANNVPFFPQYPVGKRFTDFGNPYLKVALEADGIQWHDKRRDTERDKELAAQGWRTYRISGREINRTPPDWQTLTREDPDKAEKAVRTSAEGLLIAIRVLLHGEDVRRTALCREFGPTFTEDVLDWTLRDRRLV